MEVGEEVVISYYHAGIMSYRKCFIINIVVGFYELLSIDGSIIDIHKAQVYRRGSEWVLY